MFRIIPRQGVYHFDKYFKNLLNKKINIEDFEKKLSRYLGVRNVLATGSATLSLYLILKNIKINDEDEIILAGYNYHDLVNAIKSCNMKPVFVNFNEELQMNVDEIKNKINNNTRAILVSNLFGFLSDIQSIVEIAKKKNIYIIEDVSHALGSEINNKKIGSFGDFSIFSFNKWKIVDCLGGGAIASNNNEFMKNIRNEIKDYRSPSRIEMCRRLFFNYTSYVLLSRKIFSIFIYPIIYLFDLFGKDILAEITKDNFSAKFSGKKKLKFTDIQARIGLKMLNKLDEINNKRRERYDLLFNNLKENKYKINNGISPILFPINTKNKKYLHQNLLRNGIDTTIKYYGYSLNGKNLENNLILLPIHFNINNSDIIYIANSVNELS